MIIWMVAIIRTTFFPLYNLYNLYIYIYGSIWIYNDLDIWIVVVAMPTDPTWVAKSQGRVKHCTAIIIPLEDV